MEQILIIQKEDPPSTNQPIQLLQHKISTGDGSDKYLWKYLYTIRPNDVIKFDSTDFIPVPEKWSLGNSEVSDIVDAAVDGSIGFSNCKHRNWIWFQLQ